jgi:hypothetical protein
MWEILPSEQKSEYKRMILAFASLTEVFSQKAENNENKESYAPIINSKFQETVFQKAFNASAEDIGNTSYDAAISLKLSEIELIRNEVGEYPILILDDVFSELDETRQKLLIDNLSVVQMFITTAEVSHINIFNKSNTTIFRIEKGQVINIENGGN